MCRLGFFVVLLALVSSASGDLRILMVGDSLSTGFPHQDGDDFQKHLLEARHEISFVQGSGTISDSGQPLVGGDGAIISADPAKNVWGWRPAILGKGGALEKVPETSSPTDLVIMLGTNHLIELGTAGGKRSYTPKDPDDYSKGGAYQIGDDTFEVPDLIKRVYAGLIATLQRKFPRTRLHVLALPPLQTRQVSASARASVESFNRRLKDWLEAESSPFIHFHDPEWTEAHVHKDGIHLSESGNRTLGRYLAMALPK